MPASPIAKYLTDNELPKDFESLEKVMIPDSATNCFWGVWFSKSDEKDKHTAELMWCPFGENPSICDNWCHAEEIDEQCSNVLDVIRDITGISFHMAIWKEINPKQTVRDNPLVILPSE